MPTEVTTTPPSVILQGWVPILTLVVALLAPLGPVWLANRNARRAREATDAVAERLTIADSRTSAKLDVIHSLINSRPELIDALEKLDQLEKRLCEVEDNTPPNNDPPRAPYPLGPAT